MSREILKALDGLAEARPFRSYRLSKGKDERKGREGKRKRRGGRQSERNGRDVRDGAAGFL
jgi:hypothetical protein